MNTYPRWVWADSAPFTEALRVETADSLFVDYARIGDVWRQKTRPMTRAESEHPNRHLLDGHSTSRYPQVDAQTAAWLEATYNTIGATR